jgi:hypothetical protein
MRPCLKKQKTQKYIFFWPISHVLYVSSDHFFPIYKRYFAMWVFMASAISWYQILPYKQICDCKTQPTGCRNKTVSGQLTQLPVLLAPCLLASTMGLLHGITAAKTSWANECTAWHSIGTVRLLPMPLHQHTALLDNPHHLWCLLVPYSVCLWICFHPGRKDIETLFPAAS